MTFNLSLDPLNLKYLPLLSLECNPQLFESEHESHDLALITELKLVSECPETLQPELPLVPPQVKGEQREQGLGGCGLEGLG